MKIFITPAFLVISYFLGSCTFQSAVVQLTSQNTSPKDSFVHFSNDSIDIKYTDWEMGTIQFALKNKLNVPLYVDWSKSMYFFNKNWFNYWDSSAFFNKDSTFIIDKNTYIGLKISSKDFLKMPLKNITIIKPKSSLIVTIGTNKYSGETTYEMSVHIPDSILKSKVIYPIDYSKAKAPIVFRNYLTISGSEN